MGKRGPAPEPTKLKILKGNPGKRPLNEAEPDPKGGPGPAPDWLSAEGKAHWAEYAPKLEEIGLLTAVDAPIFAQMCQVWAELQDARRRLAENDRIYVSDGGYSQISGYASDVKNLRKEYKDLSALFGMNPSSRTGLKAEKPAKSALREFLDGAG